MMDPKIGRWTTEDPSGISAGDPNFYRYAGNDPTNYTDSTGLEPVPVVKPAVRQDVQDWLKAVKIKVGKDFVPVAERPEVIAVGGQPGEVIASAGPAVVVASSPP